MCNILQMTSALKLPIYLRNTLYIDHIQHISNFRYLCFCQCYGVVNIFKFLKLKKIGLYDYSHRIWCTKSFLLLLYIIRFLLSFSNVAIYLQLKILEVFFKATRKPNFQLERSMTVEGFP